MAHHYVGCGALAAQDVDSDEDIATALRRSVADEIDRQLEVVSRFQAREPCASWSGPRSPAPSRDRAGLIRNHVGLIERGVQQPTLTTLINLAVGLGIKPEMLVSLTVGRVRWEVQP